MRSVKGIKSRRLQVDKYFLKIRERECHFKTHFRKKQNITIVSMDYSNTFREICTGIGSKMLILSQREHREHRIQVGLGYFFK